MTKVVEDGYIRIDNTIRIDEYPYEETVITIGDKLFADLIKENFEMETYGISHLTKDRIKVTLEVIEEAE